MKREFWILIFFIFCSSLLTAQRNTPVGFWKLYGYDGELRLGGFMRNQTIDRKGFFEKQDSKTFVGGVLLKTKNYIWHPRFMTVDIDGTYSPSFENEKYLTIPDRTENRDLSRLDLRMSVLQHSKFSNHSYFSYGNVYNNRENLSNLRSGFTNWGTNFFYRNKKVPLSFGYTSLDQHDKEIETGKTFLSRQRNLQGRANSSFFKNDRQELTVSHNEYYRKEYSNSEILNKINNITYNSQVPFGIKRHNYLNSFLSGVLQRGFDNFDRYQAIENINTQLHRDLRMGAFYNYFYDKRLTQTQRQNKVGINFSHQLYQSLQTAIGYDYNKSKSNYYKEQWQMFSGNLNYIKKILRKHVLEMGYQYVLNSRKWNSADAKIDIFNEPLTLVDGQITLLSKPNIILNTIQVKEITSTIIYRLNLDYILIPQNDYVQIQRIPGGLIPNNTAVYIDYSSLQPGNYQYTGIYRQASFAMYFFNRMFGIYFRNSVQDYNNLKNTAFISLNYMDRQVLGFKFDKKFISAGAEYDNMKSTIMPYELFRYFLNLQHSFGKKLIVSLNGNIYDYKKLNDINNVQFIDGSGSFNWLIGPKISFTGSAFYRQQEGDRYDLDLFNCTGEFKTVIKKLIFSVAYNYYDRSMFDERIKFSSVNVQLIRKF